MVHPKQIIVVGETRLEYKCTLATLLELESAHPDWRVFFTDASSGKSVADFVELQSLFTGIPQAEIIELSPPFADSRAALLAAWVTCLEGPEALRAIVEKEADAAGETPGKSKTLRWFAKVF